ncbi:HTH-type transcriptional activator RhaR [Comamonadaceae bacterium OS-1]|nr:HTH-type transcriptional activator RhaR [Comamonadaceae bacterium OS-1]
MIHTASSSSRATGPSSRSKSVRPARRTYGPALENEAERTLFQGFEPVSSCGVVRCLSHGFPTILNRWHYHPEYELHLIVATHGRAYVGDYLGTYEPGHLVLTGPGLPHNWLVDDLPPGGINDHIHKVLQFRDEPLREAAKVFDAIDGIFPMLDRAQFGIEFFGISALAEQRFEEIRGSQGLKRLSSFLAYLAELAQEKDFRLLSASSVQGMADTYTQEASAIIEYVAQNACFDISLKDVAHTFGHSEKYFSKHFKRSTGNSFIDFVLRLRINKACQLLADTSMYVANVCHEVGFNNVANFNRHFHKIKGMTPTDFRKQSDDRFGRKFLKKEAG